MTVLLSLSLVSAPLQITVDDKGLAAIFVFGIPGSRSQGSIAVRCLRAAMEVTQVMTKGGVKCSAGLGFGSCYCGLVGDKERRCEYAVLGGALLGARRGRGICLCALYVAQGTSTPRAFHPAESILR